MTKQEIVAVLEDVARAFRPSRSIGNIIDNLKQELKYEASIN